MLSGNSLRQTVHTHCASASVHQAAKLVAALLRVAGVTAGLAESNGSLSSGLWLTSAAGWLPRTGISSGTLRSVIEYGRPLLFYLPTKSTQSLKEIYKAQTVVARQFVNIFSVFRTDSTDPPDSLPILLSISGFFLLFTFSLFHFFSLIPFVRLSWLMSTFERTLK